MELRRPGTTRLLLELDLTEPPAEPGEDPLERFRSRGRRLLRPTLRALHEAGDDPRVVGLLARLGPGLDWVTAQELRAGLAVFRASGKPTWAWAESLEGPGTTAAVALAAGFDTFWLQPGGGLGPLGVATETTFLRGALDRAGIEPQVERRREYKNAPDQLLQTAYTEAHRESLTRLTASLWQDAAAAIAEGRGLERDRVQQLADGGPLTAAEAVQAGLADRLGYRDEVHAHARHDLPEGTELLFADRWSPRRLPRLPARRHVALVEVRGGIGSGRSRRGPMGRQVGSDTVAAQLRAAAEDDRAAALLLRVDSPGGSAVASETIWREVVRVREAGKPVVVSMGSVAASGGYYVSCPADVIVAAPATLTGSIGVFGGKLVVARLLDRFGVTTDAVTQGEQALINSSRRRWTESEQARIAAAIDAIYRDFVAKVAVGRGRTVDEIDAVAGGRVWTGRDALEAGLVDELGGLRDAARIARLRGGLDEEAPVRPALRVPPVARLGRPRNSDDPRARAGLGLLGGLGGGVVGNGLGSGAVGNGWLHELTGLGVGYELRMPELRLL
ncbi:protease-4 [Friedmanniella endophytica]|uniref:Protease-4 n=1 Tax=Microlunatus kandeliicorticis TaxID=1759536 RepID=A0A7W3P498_9ACTN|nr:signal peptide peptidase SppA [Microlunatus kandeliicorticis]MBA8792657.1 protease-4 [Microlunatus kandeliicorticis]